MIGGRSNRVKKAGCKQAKTVDFRLAWANTSRTQPRTQPTAEVLTSSIGRFGSRACSHLELK